MCGDGICFFTLYTPIRPWHLHALRPSGFGGLQILFSLSPIRAWAGRCRGILGGAGSQGGSSKARPVSRLARQIEAATSGTEWSAHVYMTYADDHT